MTRQELQDRWLWEAFCWLQGVNPVLVTAVTLPETEFTLTEAELAELGLTLQNRWSH